MEFPAALNGWTIYAHPCFSDAYHQLIASVEALVLKHPDDYQKKKETKLLAHLLKAISGITRDPRAPEYRPGGAIGENYTDWSRAKFGGQRYRLFFRYSYKQKIIVLAWVNDEDALRTYGKKTDAYRVFAKMLANNRPPDDWASLLKASQS
ncbi:type II toxin-antitoxin system YhaV family toxin [Kosakonia sacchari]|uniref:type II toxin-antitoxin system YhaV family toxin n=1 Tax=Kosakonia sacchari TaxID=1158459 RepID=UPI0030C295B1